MLFQRLYGRNQISNNITKISCWKLQCHTEGVKALTETKCLHLRVTLRLLVYVGVVCECVPVGCYHFTQL